MYAAVRQKLLQIIAKFCCFCLRSFANVLQFFFAKGRAQLIIGKSRAKQRQESFAKVQKSVSLQKPDNETCAWTPNSNWIELYRLLDLSMKIRSRAHRQAAGRGSRILRTPVFLVDFPLLD